MMSNTTSNKNPYRETVRDLFTGLLANNFGIFAGFILVIGSGVFQIVPWSLVLFPGILSARGLIGGIFSARLTTGLHIGLYKEGIRNNTKHFKNLFLTMTIIMFIIAVLIGGFAVTIEAFYYFVTPTIHNTVNIFSKSILIFLSVITTLGVSFFLIIPITVTIAGKAFQNGVDPDVVTYPITSTISDIFSSIVFLLIILLGLTQFGPSILSLITLLLFSIILIIINRQKNDKETKKEIKNLLVTILIVSVIVNITGQLFRNVANQV
ncbi:MAG: magnesium transporter, partial [Candidatus Ranarchaeia archaeon]